MEKSGLNFSDCKGGIDTLIQHCNDYDLGENTGMLPEKVGKFVGHRKFGKALIESGLAEVDESGNLLLTKYGMCIGRGNKKKLQGAARAETHRKKVTLAALPESEESQIKTKENTTAAAVVSKKNDDGDDGGGGFSKGRKPANVEEVERFMAMQERRPTPDELNYCAEKYFNTRAAGGWWTKDGPVVDWQQDARRYASAWLSISKAEQQPRRNGNAPYKYTPPPQNYDNQDDPFGTDGEATRNNIERTRLTPKPSEQITPEQKAESDAVFADIIEMKNQL